jgi:hypothetical protein
MIARSNTRLFLSRRGILNPAVSLLAVGASVLLVALLDEFALLASGRKKTAR